MSAAAWISLLSVVAAVAIASLGLLWRVAYQVGRLLTEVRQLIADVRDHEGRLRDLERPPLHVVKGKD